MATIRVRYTDAGEIRYQVIVRLRGFRPQRKTFRRKKDAKRWAAKTESDLRERRNFGSQEAARHTLAEAIDRFVKTGRGGLKESTWRRRKSRVQWWRDELGHVLLADLRPALIAEKRDELGADRSPATVHLYLAALSRILTTAVREWEWLDANPCRSVARPKPGRGEMRILTVDERRRLLEACGAEREDLRLLVLIALHTGARLGELERLTWTDVDLSRAVIHLRETKSGEDRTVPIVGAALADLKAAAAAPVRRIDGRLFPIGLPRRAWDRARRVAKLSDVRFHDLRHDAASNLAMSGATLAEIAEVLGHKTLQMVKRYSHFTEAHTRSVLERMAAERLSE